MGPKIATIGNDIVNTTLLFTETQVNSWGILEHSHSRVTITILTGDSELFLEHLGPAADVRCQSVTKANRLVEL